MLRSLTCSIVLLAGIMLSPVLASAEDAGKAVDPMQLIQDLSKDVGGSKSVSFDAITLSDEVFEGQFIKRVVRRTIGVARPNTLIVKTVSDDGETTLTEFNGERARIFYVGDKEYSDVEFKGDVDAFIDFADSKGFSRTAILDLLVSNLDEQASEAIVDSVLIEDYIDPDMPDAAVFNVLFRGAAVTWQIWLNDGEERVLPTRMVVKYLRDIGQPEHATQFSNWKFDFPAEGLAASFGVPADLSNWKKVDFTMPGNG